MNWMRRSTGYAATGRDSGLRVEAIEAFQIVDTRKGRREVIGPFSTSAEALDAAERLPARAA